MGEGWGKDGGRVGEGWWKGGGRVGEGWWAVKWAPPPIDALARTLYFYITMCTIHVHIPVHTYIHNYICVLM